MKEEQKSNRLKFNLDLGDLSVDFYFYRNKEGNELQIHSFPKEGCLKNIREYKRQLMNFIDSFGDSIKYVTTTCYADNKEQNKWAKIWGFKFYCSLVQEDNKEHNIYFMRGI